MPSTPQPQPPVLDAEGCMQLSLYRHTLSPQMSGKAKFKFLAGISAASQCRRDRAGFTAGTGPSTVPPTRTRKWSLDLRLVPLQSAREDVHVAGGLA